MIASVFEPFQYAFFARSIWAVMIVSAVCSVIGVYVVVRSMAFLGDALAHAVLPGVAVAYLFGGNLTIGALAASCLVALGVSALSERNDIREDTAIGILFTAALALGVAMISSNRSYAVDLAHILFGNVLGVTTGDLRFITAAGAVTLTVVILFYRRFLVITFDPILGRTMGWNVKLIRSVLLVLIAATITISINIVGASLVTAMLITPAATALMFTKRLWQTMIVSAGIGMASGFIGLMLSYYLNISSGAAIVLTATGFFILGSIYRRVFPIRNF